MTNRRSASRTRKTIQIRINVTFSEAEVVVALRLEDNEVVIALGLENKVVDDTPNFDWKIHEPERPRLRKTWEI